MGNKLKAEEDIKELVRNITILKIGVLLKHSPGCQDQGSESVSVPDAAILQPPTNKVCHKYQANGQRALEN